MPTLIFLLSFFNTSGLFHTGGTVILPEKKPNSAIHLETNRAVSLMHTGGTVILPGKKG